MTDVSGRAVALYLDVATHQGLDAKALTTGLDVRPRQLGRRVSWDTALEVLRRIRDGLGGDEAIADAFASFDLTSPDFRALAPHFVSPMVLARFINITLAHRNISTATATMRELNDRTYELHLTVLSGFASDPAVVHATLGLLRGHPRLLGLPEAEASWEGNEHDFTCRVTLPPAQDVGTRVRRLSLAARRRAEEYLRAALADGVAADRLAESEQRLLERLGDAAQEDTSAEQFAHAALRLLHEELGATSGAVWSPAPTPSGRRLLATLGAPAEPPPPTTIAVPVAIAGQPVAVVEATGPIGRRSLATVAPLLALALARRLDHRSLPPLRSPTHSFPSEWGLTKRQQEVAELIFQGESNPAIAAALGCSVGTVEAHVTAIFEKAGVDGRHVLSARLGEFRRGM